MLEKLKPLFTYRFLKFAAVGLSGVAVNLGFLSLFADLLKLQVNLASALSIEISINSNFIANELWTFRDRRGEKGKVARRWFQFHFVSLGGAVIQWGLFVAMNLFWLAAVDGTQALAGYLSADGAGFVEKALRPVTDPPDTGNLKYLSQLVGIGAAMAWNFLANFHWTWKKQPS